MGLDQLGIPAVGTFVSKESGHTPSHITLLVIPSWCRKPPLIVGSPKVITLGHVPHNAWSTRHSLTLVTSGMGVQGTTKAGARLQKQRMWTCLENRTRKRAPDAIHGQSSHASACHRVSNLKYDIASESTQRG